MVESVPSGLSPLSPSILTGVPVGLGTALGRSYPFFFEKFLRDIHHLEVRRARRSEAQRLILSSMPLPLAETLPIYISGSCSAECAPPHWHDSHHRVRAINRLDGLAKLELECRKGHIAAQEASQRERNSEVTSRSCHLRVTRSTRSSYARSLLILCLLSLILFKKGGFH